jgi:hypothetical protein
MLVNKKYVLEKVMNETRAFKFTKKKPVTKVYIPAIIMYEVGFLLVKYIFVA